MRFSPNARLNVVSKEQKEERLKAFISDHLATVLASPEAAPTTYRLLALSADSPAARALQALAPELSAAGVTVQTVLANRSQSAASQSGECRFVTDVRLRDAHEQLVLDETTVWIGDCMRRDPQRRDTYELFSDACRATAARAVRSFAQIWRAAGPTGSLTSERRVLAPRHAPLFDPSVIAGVDAAPSPLPFRH
jgi:uncharacterized protein with PIN domain